MKEFITLFAPILIIGIVATYFGLYYPIHFIANALLLALGIICFIIDAFALVVEYVNWRYYEEK